MKVFTAGEPVFKTDTLFVIGCSHAALATYMRRFHCTVGDDGGQIGQMFTFTDRRPWRLVWVRDVDLPVALHEVYHLVSRICADKGIPIAAHAANGEPGDEPAAYLLEFFSRALLRHVRGWTHGARAVGDGAPR